jgi:hypothetical protein
MLALPVEPHQHRQALALTYKNYVEDGHILEPETSRFQNAILTYGKDVNKGRHLRHNTRRVNEILDHNSGRQSFSRRHSGVSPFMTAADCLQVELWWDRLSCPS